MDRSEIELIKQKVEEAINKLSISLSEEDKKSGWSEAKQKFMLDFYHQLLDELNKKKPNLNKPEYTGISIRMDYAGISSGELADKGSAISHLILGYNSKHNLRNILFKALNFFGL